MFFFHEMDVKKSPLSGCKILKEIFNRPHIYMCRAVQTSVHTHALPEKAEVRQYPLNLPAPRGTNGIPPAPHVSPMFVYVMISDTKGLGFTAPLC